MSDFLKTLNEQIDNIYDYAVKIRRDIHKHPETAWLEIRTTSLIALELKKMGFDTVLTGDDVCDINSRLGTPTRDEFEEHMKLISEDLSAIFDPDYNKDPSGRESDFISAFFNNDDPEKSLSSDYLNKDLYLQTGVIGILNNGPGPVYAIRCDIDALPIDESRESTHLPYINGFSSIYPGAMHACGHDGHTATLLGLAKFISSNRNLFKGTFKLIFQPSEEGARGAWSIVSKGHLDDVNTLFGMHMYNRQPEDPEIVIESNRTLATAKIDASFTGKEAHAANSPETGHNALLASCTAVQNLYAISRYSQADTRINVGSLHAGSTRNIICPYSEMQLEVRGTTSEGNKYMLTRAHEIIHASAQMHNCSCKFQVVGQAISVPNDPVLARLTASAINKAGISCKYIPERSWSASEDFSLMADRVSSHNGKTCYIKLESETKAPLHDNKFDFGEISIRNGIIGLAAALHYTPDKPVVIKTHK